MKEFVTESVREFEREFVKRLVREFNKLESKRGGT